MALTYSINDVLGVYSLKSIFQWLRGPSQFIAQRVCKSWNRLVKDALRESTHTYMLEREEAFRPMFTTYNFWALQESKAITGELLFNIIDRIPSVATHLPQLVNLAFKKGVGGATKIALKYLRHDPMIEPSAQNHLFQAPMCKHAVMQNLGEAFFGACYRGCEPCARYIITYAKKSPVPFFLGQMLQQGKRAAFMGNQPSMIGVLSGLGATDIDGGDISAIIRGEHEDLLRSYFDSWIATNGTATSRQMDDWIEASWDHQTTTSARIAIARRCGTALGTPSTTTDLKMIAFNGSTRAAIEASLLARKYMVGGYTTTPSLLGPICRNNRRDAPQGALARFHRRRDETATGNGHCNSGTEIQALRVAANGGDPRQCVRV